MIDRMVERFETSENRASKRANLSLFYNEASIVYDTSPIYEQDTNADGVLTLKLDGGGDFGDTVPDHLVTNPVFSNTVPDHLATNPVADEDVAEEGPLNYGGGDDIVAEDDDA